MSEIVNIQVGQCGNLCGQSGMANNWAKGHYTESSKVVDKVIEAVWRKVETCNSLQSFQFTQSIDGGTGSGLGTLLMPKLRAAYSGRLISIFSVFPSS